MAQKQQELARANRMHKEYLWPDSFPDCTPDLRILITIEKNSVHSSIVFLFSLCLSLSP